MAVPRSLVYGTAMDGPPGRAFDAAALRREEAAAKIAHGAEIEEAVQWAGALADRAGVPLNLEKPLLRQP